MIADSPLNILNNSNYRVLAFTLHPPIAEPRLNSRSYQGIKDLIVIKILYMILLGSALILSLCALWLAVKELMTE
jgi:hypothetical protein